MSIPRLHRVAALGLVTALLLLTTSASAEIDEKAWKSARKEANKLMSMPGELAWKQKVLHRIGDDDSERAAETLVKWALASLRLESRTLRPELDKAEEKFAKLVKLLMKAYDKMPPTNADHRSGYDALKKIRDAALAAYEAEKATQASIAHAFSRMSSTGAIQFLLDKGEHKVAKKKGAGAMVMGVLKSYLRQPQDRVLSRLRARLKNKSQPEARILILNWIAEKQVMDAFNDVVGALKGPERAVSRSAVFTLEVLDDPRCVKPLIAALAKADGLLLEDIEDTLHNFTGRSFEGSHSVWSKWWSEEGESWLSTESTKRHGKRQTSSHKGGTTSFYGVETKSKRIVFVLDRSGSMKSPASEESRKPKPTGPVTGGPKKGDGEKPEITGDTKIEVAKNQLAWSVKHLQKDVRFNVVFYSSKVDVWKTPPEMLPATPKFKSDATDWFMKIGPEGSTRTFDALIKALDYAATEGGADTIFLLSDGAPTIVGGAQALTGEALEAEYGAFKEKNKIYKCVVHTIGVGPHHNRQLMQRIARETGGTYQSVGAK